MTDKRNADERISLWLEEDAMRHFPDHLLKATYEQTRKSRQQAGWRGVLAGLRVQRFAPAMASAAVVVVGVALAFGLFVNRPGFGPAPSATPTPAPTPSPTPDPWAAFLGTWISNTDSDGGTQTMTIERINSDSVDVRVVDTVASVCALASSTMTGTGHVEQTIRLVIPTSDYTCDDGSDPHLTNGDPTPLNEFLRNRTYTLDEAGNLFVEPAELWVREDPPPATSSPRPSGDAAAGSPAASNPWWPQSTLEQVREAQDLADAGDPEYTWQVDSTLVGEASPWDAEIIDHFLRQGLGWDDFGHGDLVVSGDAGSLYTELVLFRCATGATNPLYPDDPVGRDCAPTVDDFRYETVMLTIERPLRRDPAGIWVVTDWQMLQPLSEQTSNFNRLYPDFTFGQVEQVAPPSDAEAADFVQAFLQARVDGDGAEQYLLTEPDGSSFDDTQTPLLYGTTTAAPYERYEIDRLQGPVWPSGWIEYRTHLFAQDGTEVEQSFAVIRDGNERLGLIYGYPQTDEFPTTENGEPVATPYTFLDGAVTLAAPLPWRQEPDGALYLGNPGNGERILFLADPVPVAADCEPGPAPADAEAFAQSIQSNPNLEATAPAEVSVGGIDAIWMDVAAAGGASDCDLLMNQGTSAGLDLGQGDRVRLYLLDLPRGSAQVVAIAITAQESEFERVVGAATPLVDSSEFHTPE